jgi:hypothetical protein
MVYDTVSRHKSGKLSMAIFKAHITKTYPGTSTDTKGLQHDEHALISFPDQLPTLKQIEQLLIDEAMQRSNGNQSLYFA